MIDVPVAQPKKLQRKHECGTDSGDLGNCTYVGRIDVTLNNVENRDVACGLARYSGNHPVFGLK